VQAREKTKTDDATSDDACPAQSLSIGSIDENEGELFEVDVKSGDEPLVTTTSEDEVGIQPDVNHNRNNNNSAEAYKPLAKTVSLPVASSSVSQLD
jgi:hypothetical protein